MREARTALRVSAVLLAGVSALSCCSADAAPAPIWADEFDGAAGSFPDRSIWTAELGGGGWGNEEQQTYTDSPDNVALDGDGHLVITARATGPAEKPQWTSARITTFGKRTATRARFEVRALVPSGTGLWPAAWTLGQNIQQVGWPSCGEIDLIESVGDATRALQTVHGARADGAHWEQSVVTAVDDPLSDAFHTYSAEWTADGVTFAVDGQVTGSVHQADLAEGATWPFTGPQYVLLNVAVGGRLPGPPDASTPRTASMVVDWVRVYEVG